MIMWQCFGDVEAHVYTCVGNSSTHLADKTCLSMGGFMWSGGHGAAKK